MNIDDLDISPELKEKARACKTTDEILALAKQEGYKLSEEELEAVSGGSWSCLSDCGGYDSSTCMSDLIH